AVCGDSVVIVVIPGGAVSRAPRRSRRPGITHPSPLPAARYPALLTAPGGPVSSTPRRSRPRGVTHPPTRPIPWEPRIRADRCGPHGRGHPTDTGARSLSGGKSTMADERQWGTYDLIVVGSGFYGLTVAER